MHQNSSDETTPESNKKNSLFKVNNNYIAAISILINKMNMNDLISLKKFINQKIEILTK